MISILVSLVVIVAVVYALIWVIDVTMPAPLQLFLKIIVGVLALIALVSLIGIHLT